jgi:hypothetical protein
MRHTGRRVDPYRFPPVCGSGGTPPEVAWTSVAQPGLIARQLTSMPRYYGVVFERDHPSRQVCLTSALAAR